MFLSYSQASHSYSWVLSEFLLSFFFSIQCRSSISPELGCPSHLAKFPLEYFLCISGWPSILFNTSSFSRVYLLLFIFRVTNLPGLLHSRCWLVFVILAWSAQYPNYTPGTPCAWSWMFVTGRHPIFCEIFTMRITALFLGTFQLLHLSYPYNDKKY